MRRAAAVASLVAAVLLSSCGGEETDGVAGSRGQRWRDAVAALCAAAESGDPQEANRIFLDRAHAALHEIADAATDADPEAATTLFRAKSRVEADLEQGADAATLRMHLLELADATVEALASLGVETAGCS